MPLREYQEIMVRKVHEAFRSGKKSACIVLPCGGGKSVIMAEIARLTTEKHNRVLFLVHRIELCEQIERTFRAWGVDMNLVSVMMVQTACRRLKEMSNPQLIITDECFPAGTKIDGRAIETIKAGDYISSYNEETNQIELKKVLSVMKKNTPDKLVVINDRLVCTENHPVFLADERRYINAGNIKQGQSLLYYMSQATEMERTFRKSERDFLYFKENKGLLFERMFKGILQENFFRNNVKDEQKIRIGENERKQPFSKTGSKRKNVSFSQREAVSDKTWRKWSGTDSTAENACGSYFHAESAGRVCCENKRTCSASACIQGRYCYSGKNACNRSRWKKSLCFESERSRQEKRDGFTTERVETVKIYERADFDKLSGVHITDYVYNLEVEDNHNYFAEGILVHNCHHSKSDSYRKIYDFFHDSYRLGFTATPCRLDDSGLGDIYEVLIEGVSAKWLIENHYLSPYTYYAPTVSDLSGIKIQHGEFEVKSAEKVLFNRTVFGNVIHHYRKLADGQQAICYCVSVRHSKAMAEEFRNNGITAEHIDGTTPKAERLCITENFRKGNIKILCNVDIISEGYDVPDCSCVILLRPTRSLILYIQQAMRSMRYKPDKSAIIIDHVGNYSRFGMPDADRQWSLQSKPKKTRQKKDSLPEAKVLQCPECFYTFQSDDDVKTCPKCGYTFPKKERTIDFNDNAELKNITGFTLKYDDSPNQCKNINDLKKYAKNHGYKMGWCWYQARARGWIK